jgi:hypothetical protein
MDPGEYKRLAMHQTAAALKPMKWARREGRFKLEDPAEMAHIFAEIRQQTVLLKRPVKYRPEPKEKWTLLDDRGQRFAFRVTNGALFLHWTWKDKKHSFLCPQMTIELGPVDLKLSTADNMRALRHLRRPAHEGSAHVFWVAAREAIAAARCASWAKSWDEVLPGDVVRWANAYFAQLELDCMDNCRVALLKSPSQMRRFKKQRDSGCCGSHEEVLDGPDGKKYILGCNYGH